MSNKTIALICKLLQHICNYLIAAYSHNFKCSHWLYDCNRMVFVTKSLESCYETKFRCKWKHIAGVFGQSWMHVHRPFNWYNMQIECAAIARLHSTHELVAPWTNASVCNAVDEIQCSSYSRFFFHFSLSLCMCLLCWVWRIEFHVCCSSTNIELVELIAMTVK